MNFWKHIYFFDKNGKYYNFDYDDSQDMWTGDIYLPEVSVGLFEVGQLFILQEFIESSSGLKRFGYPLSRNSENSDPYNWLIEWETTDPVDIFLFQFNRSFISNTQSSLEIEEIGPPLLKFDQIEIPLNTDVNQSISDDGYIITNEIKSEVIQINFTINSDEENTFKRTLIIRDEFTNTIIGKFTIYAETIGEDERLKVLTQNLGYNISLDDTQIFRDTNIYEHKSDFIELNRKRKEILLEGHNIYPYIGSYKGLVNAINFFGYNNLQIREFWKNVNKTSPKFGKYIQSNPIKIFDPLVNYNDMTINIPNKNFRKTNLFSLIYKINQISPNNFDELDLPLTEEVFDYTIEEVLIKLFGLKKKLEKEFLPFNARIRDITGEADYFGLLNIKNTLSRNDKRNIDVGIYADFNSVPNECIYLQDLRSFLSFCFREDAIVGQAIIDFCNAYVAQYSNGSGNNGGGGGGNGNGGNGRNVRTRRNLILGATGFTGDELPKPPIGPDIYNILGYPYDGQNFTIADLAEVYLSYFSRYSPNLNRIGEPIDGMTSYYLPDKPNIPIGALAVLENQSFKNLTWDNIDLTWDQVSNANTYHSFDLNPQGFITGDEFIIYDPVSDISVSYIVQSGDTSEDVRDNLFDQLIALKTSLIDPFLFWDISKTELPTYGDSIRIFGSDTQRIRVSVNKSMLSGAAFLKIDNSNEILYTWDSIERGNFSEIEWTIYKEATEVSSEYFFNIRGPIFQYERLPIILPYVGEYTVEMRLYDMYNSISSLIKVNTLCVESREVEYSGWYQSRKKDYTWSSEGKWQWKDYGSYWNLPIEPSVTWQEETASLYESLDRVNAILNNFGLGTSPNFRLLNFQNNGSVSFAGPYFWSNLKNGTWDEAYHFWWDLTATTGDTPAFFEFKEIRNNTFLKIIDIKGNIGRFNFDSSITTLKDAVDKLNLSNDPIIKKYIYNVVYNSNLNEQFIQGVSRYFGKYGDWSFIDIVDSDDIPICETPGDPICGSLIYKKGLHTANNPTWFSAKFINDGVTLPKMTWIMFVYDKCKIKGKDKPRWIIRNTSNSNSKDIYFESKYLTYLFQEPGKYSISLELTDSNGNKYKKERNILIIK